MGGFSLAASRTRAWRGTGVDRCRGSGYIDARPPKREPGKTQWFSGVSARLAGSGSGGR